MVIVTSIDESESDSECPHIFVSLKDIDSQIKLAFAGALKKASEHVTKLCKQEKEAWATLDEKEDQFKFLVNQVESNAEEMVSVILLIIEVAVLIYHPFLSTTKGFAFEMGLHT